MADPIFKNYSQNDAYLFPPCIGDFLPANHQARIISAIIDRLDISEIESGYKGGGTSSYNPRMLLKIIVYSYLCNIYSGRRMESLIRENVVYMWLSGMQTPDFRTINLFRSKRLAGKFDTLFTQIVVMLNEEGIVSLKTQYIDGTKIESVANKYTFVWKGSVEKNQEKLVAKVRTILSDAEKSLEIEQSQEEQELTSDDMEDRAQRILDKMDEKGISDKKLRKSVEDVQKESAPKKRKYEEHMEILGDRNSYSKTDNDATFMRMKEDAMNNGQTKPGYNVQISTEGQFITHYDIFSSPTDTKTLIPYLKSFKDRYGFNSDEICADAGYGSEENYEYMLGEEMVPYVKYNMFHAEQKRKYRDNIFLPNNMYFNADENYYVCPMGQHLTYVGNVKSHTETGYIQNISVYRAQNCNGCPFRGMCFKGKAKARTIEINHRNIELRRQARELLTSEKGLYHRSMRPIEPEAVFGDIKFNHHFKRFCLKGKVKVKIEFGLVALVHNMRKYIKLKQELLPNPKIDMGTLVNSMA